MIMTFFPLFHTVILFSIVDLCRIHNEERQTSENVRNIAGSDKKIMTVQFFGGCFLSYLPTLLSPSDLLFETIPLAAALDWTKDSFCAQITVQGEIMIQLCSFNTGRELFILYLICTAQHWFPKPRNVIRGCYKRTKIKENIGNSSGVLYDVFFFMLQSVKRQIER